MIALFGNRTCWLLWVKAHCLLHPLHVRGGGGGSDNPPAEVRDTHDEYQKYYNLCRR